MIDKRRCKAVTRQGEQCWLSAQPGAAYCRLHQRHRKQRRPGFGFWGGLFLAALMLYPQLKLLLQQPKEASKPPLAEKTQRIEPRAVQHGTQHRHTDRQRFTALYDTSMAAYRKQEWHRTIEAASDALNLSLGQPLQREHKKKVLRLVEIKAEAQYQLRFIVEAVQTLEEGRRQLSDHRLEQLHRRAREQLRKNNSERKFKQVATVARNVGIARELVEKVLVVYIFIDDGADSRWSHLDRQFTLAQLRQVQDWYRQRAREYDVDELEFTIRSFDYSRDPYLKHSFRRVSKAEAQQFVLNRIATLNNQPDLYSYLDKLKIETGVDSVMLYLHYNAAARSYASRCFVDYQGRFDPERIHCAEQVFMFEPARNNRSWNRMPLVLAHEGLHLFGADDLYQVEPAERYDPRDIMNYYTRYLNDARVGGATAYSIGWQEELPGELPFNVIERGERP